MKGNFRKNKKVSKIFTIFCFRARKAWHWRHSALLTAMKANTCVNVASAEQYDILKIKIKPVEG